MHKTNKSSYLMLTRATLVARSAPRGRDGVSRCLPGGEGITSLGGAGRGDLFTGHGLICNLCQEFNEDLI